MEEHFIFLLKLLSDLGLFVLIWIVELIVYPSFMFYDKAGISKWHPIYTKRITIVVMPLMLLQLSLSIVLVFLFGWFLYTIVNLLLVVLTWLTTFLIFVPLHFKIDDPQFQNKTKAVQKLISFNKVRTILWSLILVLTLYKFFT